MVRWPDSYSPRPGEADLLPDTYVDEPLLTDREGERPSGRGNTAAGDVPPPLDLPWTEEDGDQPADEREEPPSPGGTVLLELFPSRLDEDHYYRGRKLFDLLAAHPGVEVWTVAEGSYLRYLLRVPAGQRRAVENAIRQAYPQAEVEVAETDPLVLQEGEEVVAAELRISPGQLYPLRLPDSRTTREGLPPPLPMAALLGAAPPDVRIALGVRIGGAAHREEGRLRHGASYQRMREEQMRAQRLHYQWQGPVNDAIAILGMFLVAGIMALGWSLYRQGEVAQLYALAGGVFAGTPLLLWLWHRLKGPELPPKELMSEKILCGPLLRAQVLTLAIGPAGTAPALPDLCQRVMLYTRHLVHPWGGAVYQGRIRRRLPPFRPVPWGAGELAALVHLSTQVPLRRHAGARQMAPRAVVGGQCRVGVIYDRGEHLSVGLPRDLLFRHHLIVAKTRKGKSTFLLHVARFLAEEITAGREQAALLVVDPHGDLADDVVASLPEAALDRTVLLDLGDEERPVGLNLLDVRLFPDRDLTADTLGTMLQRLWPANWGPRMGALLYTAVAALHMANESRLKRGLPQYTILDITPFIANRDFRDQVQKEAPAPDMALWAWLKEHYDDQTPSKRQEIALPLTTKISRLSESRAIRLLVGQSESTIDPRQVLREGGILVVKTPVGILGEETATMLGATIINLMAAVVEEQVRLPPEERRRMVALIDESATLRATNFNRMLSELGKYGLSLMMVTQSLARLEADPRLDPVGAKLRSMTFSNIDALTVFSVSAEDARYLREELGESIRVEDLVALPDFEAYARWWTEGAPLSTFRFRLLPPPPLSREQAERVRQLCRQRYGRPGREVEAELQKMFLDRGTIGSLGFLPSFIDQLYREDDREDVER